MQINLALFVAKLSPDSAAFVAILLMDSAVFEGSQPVQKMSLIIPGICQITGYFLFQSKGASIAEKSLPALEIILHCHCQPKASVRHTKSPGSC